MMASAVNDLVTEPIRNGVSWVTCRPDLSACPKPYMDDAVPLHDAERQAGDALRVHLRADVPIDGCEVRAVVRGGGRGHEHYRRDAAGHYDKETDGKEPWELHGSTSALRDEVGSATGR
jgi:hypothetical protein